MIKFNSLHKVGSSTLCNELKILHMLGPFQSPSIDRFDQFSSKIDQILILPQTLD